MTSENCDFFFLVLKLAVELNLYSETTGEETKKKYWEKIMITACDSENRVEHAEELAFQSDRLLPPRSTSLSRCCTEHTIPINRFIEYSRAGAEFSAQDPLPGYVNKQRRITGTR